MSLRTDDGQTSCLSGFRSQLDIRTSTCHVGGDGHCARLACFSHNIRFTGVLLRVQNLVINFFQGQHAAEYLGDFYRGGTHQHRSALSYEFIDFIRHGVELLPYGFVYLVFSVLADDPFIGWDDHHVQLVDLPKFSRFRFGSTRHACQFVVHAEIILKGDRGVGLRSILHLHIFFGFNCLV